MVTSPGYIYHIYSIRVPPEKEPFMFLNVTRGKEIVGVKTCIFYFDWKSRSDNVLKSPVSHVNPLKI